MNVIYAVLTIVVLIRTLSYALHCWKTSDILCSAASIIFILFALVLSVVYFI